MSELLSIGVSHKTAPLEVRERLALNGERAVGFLAELRAVGDVHEAVAVSTCGRTELYLVVGDPVEAESAVLGMLARQAAIPPVELAGSIYSQRNCDAARHLYRVTAGLDSMIIGEAEIQGQVKRAYEHALELDSTGPLTNHLFRAALATGKRVRTETAIGSGQLSLASAGVMLARYAMGGLADANVVIVGSGDMAESSARALSDSGVSLTFVAGRRASRALALAERFSGESVGIDRLPEVLERADLAVFATSSPHVLIDARSLEEVMELRDGRPLCLVDLAVPRDIDSDCGLLDGVSLSDVDDLEAVVRRNRRVRQGEAARAEGIVEEEIQNFATWLGSLSVRGTVAELHRHAEEIARGVVAENAGKWDALSEADEERLEAMVHAVVNRLLHRPTVRMKELADDRVHARMALVRDLFGLEVDDDGAIDSAGVEVQDLASIRRLPQT